MISLPQGFRVGAPEAIDARFALTIEEMRTMKDNLMPQVYFTICKDDGKIYVYNKANEANESTGKFILYEAGNGNSDEPISLEDIRSLFYEGEKEEWQI